ncbi:shikimate dehydrogenase [Pseudoxanthomonas sp. GM95]|uniref:shikimate 5-dehydrogenase n=1 Tax=Pseudoxanthomonas sp. GM95 TaxID=1881043 RepID=UPI0008C6298B|nr:shikimate 5-dehydrogenase [Pseudoxanthomonas sp. GM95]SEK67342.1 shikimate dehydrogenase [Pseudoxanthomonas sp. GM95]
MTLRINRDTRLCMSLSARPGNFGTRFQNYLYEALGLDYVYKAFSTTDLEGAIAGIRALNIRGCAVSMPFKEACIPLLDGLEPSAAAIASVNTIVNTDGVLRGYNTDYSAVASLIAASGLPTDTPLALRGSGGMGKATACALRDAGFANGHVVARNAVAGQRLARTTRWNWSPDMTGVEGGLLVNVTPIGMEGGPEADTLAFTEDEIAAAKLVFDVVALPVETPLIKRARALGKPVITGGQVVVLQAVEQFVLYTGVRPEQALIDQAAAHALG